MRQILLLLLVFIMNIAFGYACPDDIKNEIKNNVLRLKRIIGKGMVMIDWNSLKDIKKEDSYYQEFFEELKSNEIMITIVSLVVHHDLMNEIEGYINLDYVNIFACSKEPNVCKIKWNNQIKETDKPNSDKDYALHFIETMKSLARIRSRNILYIHRRHSKLDEFKTFTQFGYSWNVHSPIWIANIQNPNGKYVYGCSENGMRLVSKNARNIRKAGINMVIFNWNYFDVYCIRELFRELKYKHKISVNIASFNTPPQRPHDFELIMSNDIKNTLGFYVNIVFGNTDNIGNYGGIMNGQLIEAEKRVDAGAMVDSIGKHIEWILSERKDQNSENILIIGNNQDCDYAKSNGMKWINVAENGVKVNEWKQNIIQFVDDKSSKSLDIKSVSNKCSDDDKRRVKYNVNKIKEMGINKVMIEFNAINDFETNIFWKCVPAFLFGLHKSGIKIIIIRSIPTRHFLSINMTSGKSVPFNSFYN